MNRRDTVLALLALGAVPLISFAQQQGKVWRVGFLALLSRPAGLDSHYLGAFAKGLRELGYVEDKNLVIEWRFADSKLDRLAALADDLVRLKVDVILGAGVQASLALQKATSTIPIVFAGPADPVGIGLVKSLARPGGNITGRSTMSNDLSPKRLEMLLAMVPKLSRLAVLVDPTAPASVGVLALVEAAGKQRGVTILPVQARNPQEIDTAFSLMRQQKAGALLVSFNPMFQQQRGQIAELSAKHRLPSMAADRMYADAGCLISYGNNLAEDYRRAAAYVDKIFKGAKPGDLPVEQPTRLELVINLKTAKTLGLTIPQSLLVRADEVIQ